ncbi:hypothetical protein M758_6G133200 [Ceratodon purpureus]|nr:hypothetical protein M758_6G133200 [Ceratodon purpureus]
MLQNCTFRNLFETLNPIFNGSHNFVTNSQFDFLREDIYAYTCYSVPLISSPVHLLKVTRTQHPTYKNSHKTKPPAMGMKSKPTERKKKLGYNVANTQEIFKPKP